MIDFPEWVINVWLFCGFAQMLFAGLALIRDEYNKCLCYTLCAFVWFYLAVNFRG